MILTNFAGHRSESDRPEAEGDRGHKWRNPTTADKGKGARKGRNVGKLALLLNMPLDVFFEVCHPVNR